jgi:hypothetical protein
MPDPAFLKNNLANTRQVMQIERERFEARIKELTQCEMDLVVEIGRAEAAQAREKKGAAHG